MVEVEEEKASIGAKVRGDRWVLMRGGAKCLGEGSRPHLKKARAAMAERREGEKIQEKK